MAVAVVAVAVEAAVVEAVAVKEYLGMRQRLPDGWDRLLERSVVGMTKWVVQRCRGSVMIHAENELQCFRPNLLAV